MGEDRPRVFIVGDPKQSIYRFRRAEPRVFDAALELLRRDFAATHLRTNVTRRNARTIVEVLNRAMPGGNPLFQAQDTHSRLDGAFVLLPLAEPEPAVGTAESQPLRDVLTVARSEPDQDARYREGRVLANEIAHWVRHVRVPLDDGSERAARWSDVLVLVRRRTHLAAYERALRDAGLPFVSDRRGGLLTTLEAEDLIALLDFLTSPYADLRLAHALRSPVFGCSDEDLMGLAAASGASWWERLQGLDSGASAALDRARQLLQWWLDLAGVLPVHDLLDRIYHEGDVRRRYATVAPAALHAQIQANLDAFIELALAIDAGRYPSLPRFIDELTSLKRGAGDEAPDEGAADHGEAVRVMTIHGAKGLEAEIVVLADAHARVAPEGEGVLVVWPPQVRGAGARLAGGTWRGVRSGCRTRRLVCRGRGAARAGGLESAVRGGHARAPGPDRVRNRAGTRKSRRHLVHAAAGGRTAVGGCSACAGHRAGAERALGARFPARAASHRAAGRCRAGQ